MRISINQYVTYMPMLRRFCCHAAFWRVWLAIVACRYVPRAVIGRLLRRCVPQCGESRFAAWMKHGMSEVTEIAADVFRISTFVAGPDLQFNQFLVRDTEPLLYHAGQTGLFPDILAAVRLLLDPTTLRWIGFSHFESDECGALNRWLDVAPAAQPLADVVSAATAINEFSQRPPHVLADDAEFTTGRHTWRYLVTPYVPHNWSSSLLFDATEHVLFCSDLLLQRGNPAPLSDDVLTPALRDLARGQQGPFHDSIPYTRTTAEVFARLEALQPKVLAIMHGASFRGDGAAVLRAYHDELRQMLGAPTATRN